MTSNIVVLVLDADDPRHGEISVVEEPREAAGIMETLLEAGFPMERIRVFSGNEIEPAVTYRPIVSLDAPGTDSQVNPADDIR
jgi:hypothetical protein